MNPKNLMVMGLAVVVLLGLPASGQMTSWFQWTFLPTDQMDRIVGEASGETAFSHVLALAGMPRDRGPAEYAETFLEARYILERLLDYGLENAAIIRFPGGDTWDGELGELWETSPRIVKISSYTDLRAMLAAGSMSADVDGELIWVDEGNAEDFEGLDVKGKIVLTSGAAGRVHEMACIHRQAVGVVSFASPRPLFDPLLIPWSEIHGTDDQPAKFAFLLPPRDGILLRDRLRKGERIIVRARVRSSRRAYELQDVVATIPGSDPESGEIILTAHLFEGFEMQGANDNASGCAVILETARILRKLIDDGHLPVPKRTIRFLWGYEGRGTAAFVNANPRLMQRTLCNINLDMVGLRLSGAGAFFTLMRTSYGNPHFINDVMENLYRFVGETSRSYVANGAFSIAERRIVAPSGTEEPMHYYMGTHYGSSDHEVFNDWGVGVPGVVMNTWPDPWLHSSEDRPDKVDPTQLKRAGVITAAAAYAVVAADDRMAGQIAGEIVSNASARIGHQLARGLEEMKRASREDLSATAWRARGYIEAAAINERATLETVLQLTSDASRFAAPMKCWKGSVSGIERSALKALEGDFQLTSSLLGAEPGALAPAPLLKRLATIFPKPVRAVKGRGFEGYLSLIGQPADPRSLGIPGHGIRRVEAELRLLCNGHNSALDIKKMLDTQFQEETSPETILNHLEVLRTAGLVTF